MVTMQEIKSHYFFTEADAELLKSLQPLAEASKERMADEFYAAFRRLLKRALPMLP